MLEAIYQLDHIDKYSANWLLADKPTEHPAGWHPGPHGHELRGEILAYNYLTILEKALKYVKSNH